MPDRPRAKKAGAASDGAVAGLVAGAVLYVLMIALNLAWGLDPWADVKIAAAPLIGPFWLYERGVVPSVIALGTLIHFGLSAAWGAGFGLLLAGSRKGVIVAAGALWGAFVWLTSYYFLLPLLGLAIVTYTVPLGIALIEHLAFGLTLSSLFAARRLPSPALPSPALPSPALPAPPPSPPHPLDYGDEVHG